MKVLKWILIIIVALVASFLIYSSLQPNKLVHEDSIVIDAPASAIYKEILDFQSWGNWSVWNQIDSNMVSSYSEQQGEVGAWSEWKSNHNEVGNGRQEIVVLKENEYVKTKLNFGFGDNFSEFILEDTDEGVKLTWTFIGAETPFYFNFMNSLIKPRLAANYEKGLKQLKAYVESKAPVVENPMNLEVVEVESIDVVAIMDSTDAESIGSKLQELYTELMIFIEMNEGISQADMPLALYYSYSPEKVVLEAAIPISGNGESSGRVQLKKTPAGKTLKGIHYGDYEASGNMHNEIERYATASGMTFNGPCWEIYANDPATVDSAAVETHIYYPIQ